jgi:acyl carrier protein
MGDIVLRDRVMDSFHTVLPRVLADDAGDMAAISESTRLVEDLGMSSVSTMELVLVLEDVLEIQIDVEEITPADVASLGALADFVAGHALEE